jgi:hypothetical protein
MCFASWDKFREEFTAVFCPENKATTALMRLESDCYFQGKRNVEACIDKFKDLVDLSGYTDPITIILKFRRGLNSTTQDRIAESGTDRPQDRDFDGWFKAARRLDLNRLACKGTSVRFLTSPVLSHSTLVHMYFLSPPLYYLQGSYLKPMTSRPECPTTFQKSTHRMSSTPRVPIRSYLNSIGRT